MNTQHENRNIAFDRLRSFLTLLVVAHHSLLAYCAFAPPTQPALDGSLLFTAYPIVDQQRWQLADLLVGFNDSFFMSLMFLVSGLFVWPGIQRHGVAGYWWQRVRRLGLPFAFAAALLAPLAYFPSFLAAGGTSVAAFAEQWLNLGVWPAGPAWFLWVLLAFGGIAALLFHWLPTMLENLSDALVRRAEQPLRCFLGLIAVGSLAYLPMAALFNPALWFKTGPFFLQASRALHYCVYFMAGVALGRAGLERGPLRAGGILARRWPAWSITAVLCFVVSMATVFSILGSLEHGGPGFILATFGNFTFVLTCAATSVAFLALFRRFSGAPGRWMDSFSANAYGIYLLHYVIVTWLQYELLSAEVAAPEKAALVLVGTISLSWGMTALVRRVGVVRKFI